MKNIRRENIFIYGKHALSEALQNTPKAVRKVFLSHEAADGELKSLLGKNNISWNALKGRDAVNRVGKDAAHQGVIATIDPDKVMVDFSEFIQNLKQNDDSMLVLLDELTDPHNVGAVIRSAAAFGASGVLIPENRQAPLTGAVVKVSAGMAFRIPLISIGNINYTIDELKKKGFIVYGLEMNGKKILREEKFDGPSLIIVGNEGRGIREKTLERCDVTLKIPMHKRAESLNASVSAATVLYEWSTKHQNIL